jgi:hypothetical protein
MERERLAGGVTMGAAYLVRPEALVLAPLGALCSCATPSAGSCSCWRDRGS